MVDWDFVYGFWQGVLTIVVALGVPVGLLVLGALMVAFAVGVVGAISERWRR